MEYILYFFFFFPFQGRYIGISMVGYKAVDDLKWLCMGVTLFVNKKRKHMH
jgi:hypothetical protein